MSFDYYSILKSVLWSGMVWHNRVGNVGLYRHYEFELMKEEAIPKTPVLHYAMVRYPGENKIMKAKNGFNRLLA